MTAKRQQISWENAPYWLVKRGRFWQLRFRLEGKQYGFSTKLGSKKEADLTARNMLKDWWLRYAIEDAQATGDAILLSDSVTRYLKAKKSNWQETNMTVVKRNLVRMNDILGDVSIREVNADLFNSKLDDLKGACSPKYWANRLSSYRGFFRWCILTELLYKDPTVGIEFPNKIHFGSRTKKDCWTDEEFDLVLKELPPEYRDGLMVLKYTGIDVSDLFNLKKEHFSKDVKGNLKLIKVREKAKSEKETYDQPINSKIKRLILKRISNVMYDEDKLFDFGFNIPRNFTSAIGKRVRRAFQRLGIEPKDCKSLRHTFATYHVNRDVPMTQLRKWMGHAPGSRILEAIYDHAESSAKWMD